MSDLDDAGRRLAEARARLDRSRTALFRATEAQARLAVATARLDRRADPADPGWQAESEALRRRAADLDDAVATGRARVARGTRLVDELTGEFESFTDPRRHLGERPSHVPFLLFPLRLETRFVEVTAADGTVGDELWVRAYPDDCLVDTFEETPAEPELLAAERFWVDQVAAGGDDALQRGAWRAFASTSGHGRAAWLLDRHAPAPDAVLPQRTDPSDVILVVTAQPWVPEAEKPAVAAYWAATWRAGEDLADRRAAAEALDDALGAARAAVLRDATMPRNLAVTPIPGADRAAVRVEVAFLELPDLATAEAQRSAWSHAPSVRVLPERLVLRAYRGGALAHERLGEPIPAQLVTGFDPLAAPEDQPSTEDGDLELGPPMRWLADFDEAVRVGMGFRVPLDAGDVDGGFDELLVIGVRMGADQAAGAALVSELFAHHRDGTAGFGLLPQGTATNNVEGAGAGYSAVEADDESYDLVFGGLPPLERVDDWLTRPDAQWLAEMLGIDLATFDRTLHARGRDQCEARAMNTALWPATWGYLLETMLRPVLTEDTVELVRWFFTTHVVGRGTVPAVRVGDQPYGILPTTAFSRVSWTRDDGVPVPQVLGAPPGVFGFLAGLERVLAAVRADWQPLVDQVPHVGGAGDPHQVLLDVVGLHGSSVEFHQRYAESLEQLTNRLRLDGSLGELIAALTSLDYLADGMGVLRRLGYDGEAVPELLEKLFVDDAFLLQGAVVDDAPLSETDPVRSYTDDGRNYLTWLADAARSSFDVLRSQEGFTDGRPPVALLYLTLRHALQLGYWDTSLRLHADAGVLSAGELQVARLDPSFVHVAEPVGETPVSGREVAGAALTTSGKPVRMDQRSESRYEFLYRADRAVTGDPELLVADYIGRNLGDLAGARNLDAQLRALDELTGTPTARLERVFGEHLDLCTYRLDAWRAGLLHHQLAALRYGGAGEVRGGVCVGAFGWLSDVRSERKVLTPVELPAVLDAVFNPPDDPDLPPLVRDDTNAGFIHAPSLNHGTAAAVLRNGYLADATPGNPGTLKVNLSSERVRAALGVLEGVRAGQKLGALLGYRLERGLHDRHEDAEVDRFVYALRTEFPLVADHLTDTVSEPGDDITLVEARNVVDGLALVTRVNDTGDTGYPFGLTTLPPASPDEAAVIDEEVDRIRDLNDAVADLALAEGVYQTVLGNVDRVAATLDAYGRGTFPPEPGVVAGPRSGIHLTHRVGLHLEAGLDPAVSPSAVPVTPRSHAEPAVNAWLAARLPDPGAVFCSAGYLDAADGVRKSLDVTQEDLGLQPVDLLHVLDPQADRAMTALDDLLVRHVLSATTARWDAGVTVDHAVRSPGRFSFFEVAALIRPLRTLFLASRPLTAADAALTTEASVAAGEPVFVDRVRLDVPLTALAEIAGPSAADDLTLLSGDITALVTDPVAHRADIVAAIDVWIDRAATLLSAAGRYGLQGAGTGFLFAWKGGRIADLLALVQAVADRWVARLGTYDDIVDVRLPAASTDDERFALLRRAEAEIATAATVPLPATVADYLAQLGPMRAAFEAKLGELTSIATDPGGAGLSALLQRIAAAQPLGAFESIGLDVSGVEDEVVRFAAELAGRVDLLRTGIGERVAATQALLDSAAALTGPAAARAWTEAARSLLGDDFRLVPEFELSPAQATEWANAYAGRDVLLSYLRDPPPDGLAADLPVDDWLHGVARVREPARAWEQVTMLTGAFRTAEPALTPVQFPYRADDRWLGLDHPPDYAFDGERLLYTAHYATPFDAGVRQCGLLLDEWTEVIPTREETTGLTFHYDRPSSEPPQVLLLVTSPQLAEPWRWEDLVDGVREAFAEARLRAVEPTQVDGTDYATVLPATVAAVTRHPITIMLNLAVNNQVATLLEADDG